MKIIFFKYGKEYELFSKNKGDLLERILFTLFIFLFTTVIFFQISLIGPQPARLAASGDPLEGSPLGTEEYLYSYGTIELRLMGSDQDPALDVLVNGEKVAAFDNKDVKLEVVAGDIIEIDGSNTVESEVALCAVSDTLSRDHIGQVFTIHEKIEKILQVKPAGD